MNSTEPYGLVEMTNDEYHSGPGVSKSHLDVISPDNGGCPLDYWDSYINPEPPERNETDDMLLGTVFHTAVMEPDLFNAQYISVPEDAPKRPTARQREAKKPSLDTLNAIEWWDDFEKESAGKRIVSAEIISIAQDMATAVRRHPVASRLFKDGVAEQSLFARDEETGLLIKCRPDWTTNGGLMVDLKSTNDPSPAGFAKSVVNFRYFVQAPWYLDIPRRLFGEAPEHFIFVAVKKKRPYSLGIYYVEQDLIERGRAQYRKDLNLLARCIEHGQWPDYGTEAVPLTMPRWFMNQAT